MNLAIREEGEATAHITEGESKAQTYILKSKKKEKIVITSF
jgi:hypothetical protein